MAQDYANHRQLVPMYHYILTLILVLTLIGSLVNLWQSLGTESLYSAALIVALTVALFLTAWVARSFPLRAQDRAIRAEENLRHFVLTGELVDPRMTMRQFVALRFAGDEEFVELARRAVEEGLSEGDIKKAVRSWRADLYRV